MKKIILLLILSPFFLKSQESIKFTNYAPNAFNTLWRNPMDFDSTFSALEIESRYVWNYMNSYYSEYFKGRVAFGEKTEFMVVVPYHFFDHNFSDSTSFKGSEIGDIDLIFNLKIFSSPQEFKNRIDWYFTGEFTTAPTAATYFQTTDKLRMLGSLNARYTREGDNDFGLVGGFASGGWDDYKAPNQKHFLRTNLSAFIERKLHNKLTFIGTAGGFYLVAEGKNNSANSFFLDLSLKSKKGWHSSFIYKQLNLGISPRRSFSQLSLSVKIPLGFKL